MEQELIDFVKTYVATGRDPLAAKTALLKAGWPESDIDEALRLAAPPEVASTPAGPSIPAASASPRPSRRASIFVAGAIAALLVLGGGAHAYTIFLPSPERVLQEAFQSTALLTSVSFSGHLRFTPTSPALLPAVVGSEGASLAVNGHFEKRDSGPAIQIALALGAGADAPNAEMRVIDRVWYARVANSDKLGGPSTGERWLKVDKEELGGVMSGAKLDEETSRIGEALRRPEMWRVLEVLPREKIGGKNTFHYRVGIDPEAFARLLQDSQWGEAYVGSLPQMEVWVGFWDRLPYRIRTVADIPAGNMKLGAYELDLTFSDHGQPVSFEAPRETMTPGDLLGIIFGLGPESGTPAELLREARDASRLADLSALEGAVSRYLADGQPMESCSAGTIYSSEAYAAGTTAVDGGGWVPLDLRRIKGGSPLSKLPTDPRNENQFIYLFACDPQARTFELSALMESAKFRAGGAGDVVSKDGGLDPSRYELGNGLSLIPRDVIGTPNLPVAPRLSVPSTLSLSGIQEDVRRIRDIRMLQSSLEIYYDRVGSYPRKISGWTGLIEALRKNDPEVASLADSGEVYYFSPDGASYVLVAELLTPDLVESPFTGKISIWGKDLNCAAPGFYCVSF